MNQSLRFARFFLIASLTIPVGLVAPGAFAQEEGTETPGNNVIVQKMVIAAAGEDGAIGSVQVFSTSSGDGLGKGGVFFSEAMVSPDIFSLANNAGVQKEIELVEEQLEQIRQINDEFSSKMSGKVRELTSGGMNPVRGRELSELIKEMNEQKQSRMESVLLPHQVDRLRQISLQVQMNQSGDAATLASDQLVEALGIDDEQKKRLEERAEEIRAELERKITALRDKAREELLGELTRGQREKLDEMTGARFDVPRPEFGRRFSKTPRDREAADK